MQKYINKINIKDIEKFFKVKIKRNSISLGGDTATYHTAFAVLRTTDCFLIIEELVKVDVPKLGKTSTIKQVLDNVDLFTEQLDNLKNNFSQKYKFNNTIIEDCYMGFNPKTTKMLAYNGILTYDRMKRISNNTTLMMPTSARKAVNFKKINKTSTGDKLKKEIVHYVNKGFQIKLKIKENDKADAIILALAGLIK